MREKRGRARRSFPAPLAALKTQELSTAAAAADKDGDARAAAYDFPRKSKRKGEMEKVRNIRKRGLPMRRQRKATASKGGEIPIRRYIGRGHQKFFRLPFSRFTIYFWPIV